MLRAFAAILLIGAFPPSALAWNALGHKTIADITWRQLDAASREHIVGTLRRHPRFDADFAAKMEDDALKGDKTVQDRWIFLHAATWPDIARGLPKGERSEYDRPVWHYVNFPLFVDPSDRAALGDLEVNLSADYTLNEDKKRFNVLQAIQYSRAAIRSKAGPDTKALAYCWLMHIVGDIHQPLHSTALFSVDRFPKGDRGGNQIPLTRGSNLHSLWDGLLGRQHYLRNVDKAVYELSDRQRFGDVWESAAKERNPRKWAQESHELCKTFVYSDEILQAVRGMPAGEKLAPITLPDSYLKEAGHQARRRVIAAGLRLAALLQNAPDR